MPRPDFSGYSLWLMPAEQEVHAQFSQCILQLTLQQSPPGEYFMPHVTLFSYLNRPIEEAEMRQRTQELVNGVQPFTVKLAADPMTVSGNHFQAIILAAGKSVALMALNLRAREIFDGLNDPIFQPHLSLAYGDIDDQTRRKMMTGVAQYKLPIRMTVDSVHLLAIPSSDPKTWNHLERFFFTG